MVVVEQLSRVVIEAELYRLQHHNCNGWAIVRADGTVEGEPCKACERIAELQSMLRGDSES